MWTRDIVQDIPPDDVIDLSDGFLGPELLPVSLMANAYATAIDRYGAAALSYGANEGALPLRSALAERMQAASGRPCRAANVLVTAGSSQALHLLVTTLGRPGDVVLCEQTSYHLALRLFSDYGLRPIAVPTDAEGPDPEALSQLVRRHRAAGNRVCFAYLIPTFHNPTGRLVAARRRGEILAASKESDLPIIEDDAYAELFLDPVDQPPAMAATAGYQGVIQLCTFSKTLGPGLRLGWMLADPKLISRLADGGLLSSGGCLNHMASLAATVLLRGDGYKARLLWLREQLKARRDALVSGLHEGGIDTFDVPHGGFFLWLRAVDDNAAPAGVRVADGSRFGHLPEPWMRLSYSFNSPADLAQAGYQLASASASKRPKGQ